MSNAVPFDTLKFVEKLEAGGFTHAQAKAAAEAFAEATSQELSTKADIASVRSDIEIAERDLKIWFARSWSSPSASFSPPSAIFHLEIEARAYDFSAAHSSMLQLATSRPSLSNMRKPCGSGLCVR